jgi:tRNA threonylcarbamoyladenosine biosynthesis protein TsaE
VNVGHHRDAHREIVTRPLSWGLKPVIAVRSRSADATRRVGRALGQALVSGDVLTLAGPFGAGKTTLMQGVAEGLGAREWLGSPSFALVNEYLPSESGARVPLFHLDLYRLSGPDDVLGIGLDDYLARGGVVAVEWPAAALEALPTERLDVEIAYEGDGRRIELRPRGQRPTLLAQRVLSDPGDR